MRSAVKDPFKLASSYVDCLIKQHNRAAPFINVYFLLRKLLNLSQSFPKKNMVNINENLAKVIMPCLGMIYLERRCILI